MNTQCRHSRRPRKRKSQRSGHKFAAFLLQSPRNSDPKDSHPAAQAAEVSREDAAWARQVSNLRPLPCEGESPRFSDSAKAAQACSSTTESAEPTSVSAPTSYGLSQGFGSIQGPRSIRVLEGGANHFLSVKTVAARLGVSSATIYKLCEGGDLSHVRVSNTIRIAPADLTAYLTRGTVAGSEADRMSSQVCHVPICNGSLLVFAGGFLVTSVTEVTQVLVTEVTEVVVYGNEADP